MDSYLKRKDIVIALTITIFLTLSISLPALGAVNKIVAEDSGQYYEYNYQDLNESYAMSLMQAPGTELYDHFRTRTAKAFYDSVKGYVDYNDTAQAYALSLMEGTAFDLDNYTSTLAAVAQMPNTILQVSVVNGQIETVQVNIGLPSLIFETQPGLSPGKTMVLVKLNTSNPEEYTVKVGNVTLQYNATGGKFWGEVDTALALESNVVVSDKGEVEFQVISIE